SRAFEFRRGRSTLAVVKSMARPNQVLDKLVSGIVAEMFCWKGFDPKLWLRQRAVLSDQEFDEPDFVSALRQCRVGYCQAEIRDGLGIRSNALLALTDLPPGDSYGSGEAGIPG